MPIVTQRNDIHEFLRRSRGWLTALGVVMLILGAAAVILPFAAGLAVTVVVGWLLLIGGVFQLAHAMRSRSTAHFLWELLLGVLYIVGGGILLLDPSEGVVALSAVLAALLIVEGVFQVLLAWRLRPAAHWGWMLANGVLALVLGLLIWSGLPGSAAWVIGLMVGIDLIFNGVTLLFATAAARRA